MTAFEHPRAADWIGTAPLRVRSTLRRGLKALQYGQMIAALNRLPDTYLDETGLRRRDIPEHARRAVYGED
jgi:uncharacterized protein YjiS (DUF1127 family)